MLGDGARAGPGNILLGGAGLPLADRPYGMIQGNKQWTLRSLVSAMAAHPLYPL